MHPRDQRSAEGCPRLHSWPKRSRGFTPGLVAPNLSPFLRVAAAADMYPACLNYSPAGPLQWLWGTVTEHSRAPSPHSTTPGSAANCMAPRATKRQPWLCRGYFLARQCFSGGCSVISPHRLYKQSLCVIVISYCSLPINLSPKRQHQAQSQALGLPGMSLWGWGHSWA